MAAPRLYRIGLAVGGRVSARDEVRYIENGAITVIPAGSKGTVTEVDGHDAIVVFDTVPDVALRVGDYELRRAA